MSDLSDLVQIFKDAVTAFNGAHAAGNYDGLSQYLHAHVEMQKVDDPQSVVGDPTAIITYLNISQKGQWPQLQWVGEPAGKIEEINWQCLWRRELY